MILKSSETMPCRPVNVVCWKRAICLEFMEKVSFPDTTICFIVVPCSSFRSMLIELYALSSFFPFTFSTHNAMLVLAMQADVLEYYDQTVSSPSGSFYIPAVLRVCVSYILWLLFLELLVLSPRCHVPSLFFRFHSSCR